MTEACFSVVWGVQSTVFALFSDTPYHILDSGSRVVKTRPHRLLASVTVGKVHYYTVIRLTPVHCHTSYSRSLTLLSTPCRRRRKMASSGMLISDTCSCLYHANTAVDAPQTFVRRLNDVLQSNWTGEHDCYFHTA